MCSRDPTSTDTIQRTTPACRSFGVYIHVLYGTPPFCVGTWINFCAELGSRLREDESNNLLDELLRKDITNVILQGFVILDFEAKEYAYPAGYAVLSPTRNGDEYQFTAWEWDENDAIMNQKLSRKSDRFHPFTIILMFLAQKCPDSRTDIAAGGGIGMMMHILKSTDDAVVTRRAIVIVQFILQNKGNKERFVQQVDVAWVARVLESSNPACCSRTDGCSHKTAACELLALMTAVDTTSAISVALQPHTIEVILESIEYTSVYVLLNLIELKQIDGIFTKISQKESLQLFVKSYLDNAGGDERLRPILVYFLWRLCMLCSVTKQALLGLKCPKCPKALLKTVMAQKEPTLDGITTLMWHRKDEVAR